VEENRRRGKLHEFEAVSRQIFYDTDYLTEEQRLDLRLCPDCCGFRRIASSAVQASGRRYAVFAISLPQACCVDCADRARNNYEDAKSEGGYDLIYLQDRINDEFRVFDDATGQETVL